MRINRKPIGYWNYENCKEIALKCETRNEFHKNHYGAYKSAKRNGWLEDICSKMIKIGNLKKRIIYVYEFSDNHAYIGLTCDEKKRNNNHHSSDSPIQNHIEKTNLIPERKFLTNEYIDVEEAQKLEKFWINEYKKYGWKLLNKKKGGELGGNILIWTKEKCHEVALKCSTRKEFAKKYTSAYISSRKNKWLNEICLHMKRIRKPIGYWNYENCKMAALLCETRFEYSRKFSSAHLISRKNDWLKDFFPVSKN